MLRNIIRSIECKWSWFLYKNSKSTKKFKVESAIGWYVVEKFSSCDNKEEIANEALRFLKEIMITKVIYKGKKITIYCSKPGLLIGSKGKGFEDLQKYLGKFLNKNIKLYIKEDGTWNNLTGFLLGMFYDENHEI